MTAIQRNNLTFEPVSAYQRYQVREDVSVTHRRTPGLVWGNVLVVAASSLLSLQSVGNAAALTGLTVRSRSADVEDQVSILGWRTRSLASAGVGSRDKRSETVRALWEGRKTTALRGGDDEVVMDSPRLGSMTNFAVRDARRAARRALKHSQDTRSDV